MESFVESLVKRKITRANGLKLDVKLDDDCHLFQYIRHLGSRLIIGTLGRHIYQRKLNAGWEIPIHQESTNKNYSRVKCVRIKNDSVSCLAYTMPGLLKRPTVALQEIWFSTS